MFAEDLTSCFSHSSVEGGDHWIYVYIVVAHDGKRCKPPTYYSLEGFQHVGIFQLFEVKLESCVFWLANFFQAKAEGRHQQVVITSIVCSWKASCSGNVHSWSEVLPHQNVINLFVVLSIWAIPCPSSGCFVMTKYVRQHKVVKGGKLQKSESYLICVVIAEGSTTALPISTSIPAHFCIPVSLCNKNVLLRCLSMTFCGWYRILLFCCHRSLMLGRMLVVLWCWKGLPSGGWW